MRFRAPLATIVLAGILGCSSADGGPNTRPPNAEGQTPAFPEQTRAPVMDAVVELSTRVMADGLDHPWALDFLPDGDLLVTERSGQLKRISPDGQATVIGGVPEVVARRQGGLLDVSLAPDFADSRHIYLSYSEPRGDGKNGTSVMRARLNQAGNQLENQTVIFRQKPAWDSGHHFGSRLVWDRDGQLFVTTGDRGAKKPRQLSQSLQAHVGKVIRIKPDGGIPADNPYAQSRKGLPEIWSYGHRNLQGAAIHPDTGELWTVEHGPRGGDELNTPAPGINHGWPVITYGEDYSGAPIGEGITAKDGMAQPLYYWDPVIAPGGMAFCGDNCPAEWQGNLLISSLNPGGIVRLELNGKTVVGEERLLGSLGRVRDLDFDAEGALWVVTDSRNGKLVRIQAK